MTSLEWLRDNLIFGNQKTTELSNAFDNMISDCYKWLSEQKALKKSAVETKVGRGKRKIDTSQKAQVSLAEKEEIPKPSKGRGRPRKTDIESIKASVKSSAETPSDSKKLKLQPEAAVERPKKNAAAMAKKLMEQQSSNQSSKAATPKPDLIEKAPLQNSVEMTPISRLQIINSQMEEKSQNLKDFFASGTEKLRKALEHLRPSDEAALHENQTQLQNDDIDKMQVCEAAQTLVDAENVRRSSMNEVDSKLKEIMQKRQHMEEKRILDLKKREEEKAKRAAQILELKRKEEEEERKRKREKLEDIQRKQKEIREAELKRKREAEMKRAEEKKQEDLKTVQAAMPVIKTKPLPLPPGKKSGIPRISNIPVPNSGVLPKFSASFSVKTQCNHLEIASCTKEVYNHRNSSQIL